MNKKKYVMVCPKCKSPDIYRDNSNVLSGAVGLPSMWICSKCEFSSYSFPEVSIDELDRFEEDADIKGTIDKSESRTMKVDTQYGRGIVKGYWKVMGPLSLFFGLSFLVFTDNKVSGLIFVIGGSIISYVSLLKK